MESACDSGILIKQIHDGLPKSTNNALGSQNITLAQLKVLDQPDQASEGRYSPKELEQILHVAQSTAAGIISRLEHMALRQVLEMLRTGESSGYRSHQLVWTMSAPPCPIGLRQSHSFSST